MRRSLSGSSVKMGSPLTSLRYASGIPVSLDFSLSWAVWSCFPWFAFFSSSSFFRFSSSRPFRASRASDVGSTSAVRSMMGLHSKPLTSLSFGLYQHYPKTYLLPLGFLTLPFFGPRFFFGSTTRLTLVFPVN